MHKPTIVYLSTYPPYEDGIATFTHDLVEAQRTIYDPEVKFSIAAIDILGQKRRDYPKEVSWVIDRNRHGDYLRLAKRLNRRGDIACVVIQHEYGIFGGDLGNYLLDFLRELKHEVVVTMHTVLPDPADKMKEITQHIINRAKKIVVMSRHSRDNLLRLYVLDNPDKIVVIAHGIHPVLFTSSEEAKVKAGLSERIILGTFGFLSPGKGIEYVIQALPKIVKRHPNVEYWVMGRTHPLVQKEYGEHYRQSLQDLVIKLKLEKNVRFYNKYMSVQEILNFLETTDIYIATSLNPEQTVSGTFSYALGSGRCVISTKFAQAKEMIKRGGGVLVDFRSAEGYREAIVKLLKLPQTRVRMQRKAWESTRYMLWSNVGISYMEASLGHVLPEINLKHLKKLTDRFGIIQFAKGTQPDKTSGYTLDDNARALIVANRLQESTLVTKYLQVVAKTQKPDGSFGNYLNLARQVDSSLNAWEDIEDANGRALWALGAVNGSPLSKRLWQKWEKGKFKQVHLRSRAFVAKGIYQRFLTEGKIGRNLKKLLRQELDVLVRGYREHTRAQWKWFEDSVTYANGVLVEAMLIGFAIVGSRRYLRVGLSALDFLIGELFKGGVYLPVGQSGWWVRGKSKAEFDQQPEEVQSTIAALVLAYQLTHEAKYKWLAYRAFYWFLGSNLLGLPIYDRVSGGCGDGLTPTAVNTNQGAESTISYLLARLDIQTL